MNPHAAQLYTDGSCYKNPGGPGGLAGILIMPEDINEPTIIFQEGYKSTTNNRMEIKAIICALKYIKNNSQKLKNEEINQIEIWTDSETTRKCHGNAEQWRSNNWTGKDGIPIQNQDLIKSILTLKNAIKFSYTINHVTNKSTYETKLVDRLAKEAAKQLLLEDDTGYIEPKVSSSKIKGPTEPFNAQGQQIIIRVFGHGPISRNKNSLYKIKFEVLTDANQKYYAYTSQNTDNLLHRWHYYKAQFNNDPQNPTIEMVEEVDESEFIS